jgi:hypothetical protein
MATDIYPSTNFAIAEYDKSCINQVRFIDPSYSVSYLPQDDSNNDGSIVLMLSNGYFIQLKQIDVIFLECDSPKVAMLSLNPSLSNIVHEIIQTDPNSDVDSSKVWQIGIKTSEHLKMNITNEIRLFITYTPIKDSNPIVNMAYIQEYNIVHHYDSGCHDKHMLFHYDSQTFLQMLLDIVNVAKNNNIPFAIKKVITT